MYQIRYQLQRESEWKVRNIHKYTHKGQRKMEYIMSMKKISSLKMCVPAFYSAKSQHQYLSGCASQWPVHHANKSYPQWIIVRRALEWLVKTSHKTTYFKNRYSGFLNPRNTNIWLNKMFTGVSTPIQSCCLSCVYLLAYSFLLYFSSSSPGMLISLNNKH